MSRLTSSVVTVPRVAQSMRRDMYALFRRHYEDVDLATFLHDLDEKDDVIVLRDSAGILRGFSTVRTYDRSEERLFFSGDTIVEEGWWGEQELGRAWCRLAGQVFAEAPEVPLYWLLLSKGHRTYSYLPLFFHDFHPRHGGEMPAHLRAIRDSLASMKYGASYDAARGVVAFASAPGRLREDIAEIGEHRLRREHVRFFLSANPRYREGHELVCIAPLHAANLRGFARQCFEEGVLSRERTALTRRGACPERAQRVERAGPSPASGRGL
jgi:hypothetical protein